jgi:hypothetical protein
VKRWIALVAVGIAGNAHAGVYGDALAKSDKDAIAQLRTRKDDVAARCTLGAIYAKKADLARAALYLDGCRDQALPEDISETVARAVRDVARKLRESELSSIVVSIKPDGVTLSAKTSALPDETFAIPRTIWVKAGTYEIVATDGTRTYKQTVTVGEFSRTSTLFETDAKHEVTAPKDGKADFSEENLLESNTTGSPKAIKHKSLIKGKYTGEATGPAGNLEDPMEVRRVESAPRDLWLGLRLGGGMFDDGATSARVGGAVGATLRYALSPRLFASGRFDWSRRGGASIDVLGASAGAGITFAKRIALIAQLRGDLRFGDIMDMSTVGASAAVNLEFALPSTPITAGLRFEQGLTEIVPGARDRAVLLELGVDWR